MSYATNSSTIIDYSIFKKIVILLNLYNIENVWLKICENDNSFRKNEYNSLIFEKITQFTTQTTQKLIIINEPTYILYYGKNNVLWFVYEYSNNI